MRRTLSNSKSGIPASSLTGSFVLKQQLQQDFWPSSHPLHIARYTYNFSLPTYIPLCPGRDFLRATKKHIHVVTSSENKGKTNIFDFIRRARERVSLACENPELTFKTFLRLLRSSLSALEARSLKIRDTYTSISEDLESESARP